MVRRARTKNVLRGVRDSLNRFFSILCIVALGSGFLAGLFAAPADMYEAADRYLRERRLFDIDVRAAAGFTEEDVAAVRALPGVAVCQPGKTMDMIFTGDNGSCTVRVFGKRQEDVLNDVELLDGRMPRNAGECVIQNVSGNYATNAPKIGQTIRLSEENRNLGTLRTYVKEEELRVVGLVRTPLSISIEGEVTTIGSGTVAVNAFVPQDFFTFDFYTDLYLAAEGAAAPDTFSDAYREAVKKTREEVLNLGATRAPGRTEQVREAAQQQLNALRELAARLETVKEATNQLRADAAVRARQTAQTATALGGAIGAMLCVTADAILAQSEAPAQGAPSADRLIGETQSLLDSLGSGTWNATLREDLVGFSGYKSNVGKISALSKVFPVFFFLVALLVALTTMTRLVDERRAQIGTLKSLGFSGWEILSEYLFYSLSASLIGCGIGMLIGFRLFPSVIAGAYGMMYDLPGTPTPFRPQIALWVAPITVGSILIATVCSCAGSTHATPAALLRPSAPPAGRRILLERIPALWRHIPFGYKMTLRNLFRYKKRLFMTLVGTAGCSALLVTGFGLRDSIHDIVDKQFGQIYRYELTVIAQSPEKAEADPDFRAFIGDPEKISAWSRFSTESGKARVGDAHVSLSLTVPADVGRVAEFITLRERVSGKALTLQDGSILLTEKAAQTLGLRVGDTLVLENADGAAREITLGGITENYVTAFAYLTPATYTDLYGTAPVYTEYLCRLAGGISGTQAAADAMACEGILYARSCESVKTTFADSVKSIDSVVLVLILSAGLLSVVVLYNLTNVNICERKRELATIRVLGFHEHEVERYIFRETNLLSFSGSFIGLFAGIFLHAFVVRTVEIEQVMFGRTIYFPSFLYAAGIAVLFTLLVDLIMKRPIRRVDMVEAMKANE